MVAVSHTVDHDSLAPRARAAPSGARSAALIAGASLLATALNYVFLLVAGRLLGSVDYGSLAALLGLLTAVLLPASALQMAVSREISRQLAVHDSEAADAFARATLRLGLIATVPITALALALSLPLAALLHIDPAVVSLAAVALVTALAFPISLGVLQGQQRFGSLAATYVLPFAARLVLFAAAVWAGARLGGAVLAVVIAAVAGTAFAVLLIREPLHRGAAAVRPALGPFVRYLVPVLVGLIGMAALTNVDVLVVKAGFSAHQAGIYAGASAFARLAFFLPATVLSVLFPRTAARQARGEETEDILGRSLLVTAAFCGLLAVFYAMAGEGLLVTTFGREFAAGGSFMAPYAIAMGLFSLANVLVGYHLSRGELRFAWIVAAAVAVQVVLLAVVPSTLRGVVWVDIGVGVALLAAHEILVERSTPALRAGMRRLIPATLARSLRRIAIEGACVLVAYTAVAVTITWPLARDLRWRVIGVPDSDVEGGVWWYWALAREGGYHLLGVTKHVLTGAPIGWVQANALNIQWLFPNYPAYLLSRVAGEVTAYNTVVFTGLVLSAVAMYALARRLGCNPLIAGWAGLVYLVFPWHIDRVTAGHVTLVHLEVFPLLLLALYEWTRRPTIGRVVLVGLATTFAWISSGYWGAMAVIGGLTFAVVAAPVLARGRGFRAAARLAAPLAGSILAVTAAIGVFSLLGRTGGSLGIQRAPQNLWIYGARPLEFLIPTERHWLLGSALTHFRRSTMHGSNPQETSLYLGWLTMAAAVGWLVLVARKRRVLDPLVRSTTWGYAAIVAVALAITAPSPIVIAGWSFDWTPSWFLWKLVPELRVPSRFIALVVSALVPLAALGLQALVERVRAGAPNIRTGHIRAVLLAVFAIAFSLVELLSTRAQLTEANRLPAPYQAVARTPRGVLAEYPLTEGGYAKALQYVFWQRLHHRPLLNGSQRYTLADDVRRSVLDPGAPGTANALALLGVTSIVTRANALDYTDGGFGKGARNARTVDWGKGYKLVGRFRYGVSVWQVVAAPAPAVAVLPLGEFGLPAKPSHGVIWSRLVGDVGHIELLAPHPGTIRLTFVAFSPPGSGRQLHVSGAKGRKTVRLDGKTLVSVSVLVPRGRSRVTVSAAGGAGEAGTDVLVTPPRAGAASGVPELRAQLVSPDPGFHVPVRA